MGRPASRYGSFYGGNVFLFQLMLKVKDRSRVWKPSPHRDAETPGALCGTLASARTRLLRARVQGCAHLRHTRELHTQGLSFPGVCWTWSHSRF